MRAKKEARKLAGITGGKGTGKSNKKRNRIVWQPVTKWREPDEVLIWERRPK